MIALLVLALTAPFGKYCQTVYMYISFRPILLFTSMIQSHNYKIELEKIFICVSNELFVVKASILHVFYSKIVKLQTELSFLVFNIWYNSTQGNK